MAKANEKRIAVTLECTTCKRRNYITTKNKVNDRERVEMKKYCRWDRDPHAAQGDAVAASQRRHRPEEVERFDATGRGPSGHRRSRR